jgi:diguanylate cyclase (GGDEF)-like protein
MPVSTEEVRDFVERYLLHAGRSKYEQAMFEAFLRRKSPLMIQVILIFLLGFLLLTWPTDYLYFSSEPIIQALASFRISIGAGILIAIVGLEFCTWVQKHIYVIGSCLVLASAVFPGYFLGTFNTVRLPFLYLVIPMPFIPAFFRIRLPQRIFLTILVPLAYVIPFLFFASGSPNYYILMNVTAAVVMISVLLGHMVYHLERKRFFRRRTLRSQRQKIKRLARRDALTGLLNRKTFFSNLNTEYERSVRANSNLSLMMIDIDNFKVVNDTYGHMVGDTVLERFGEILSSKTRKNDIAGRYGGEELAVILPETTAEKATVMADRLLSSFEAETFTDESGEEFTVTCSIGLTERTDSTEDVEDLVEWADRALYRAKARGRNRFEVEVPE